MSYMCSHVKKSRKQNNLIERCVMYVFVFVLHIILGFQYMITYATQI
jgi:hypothetical protein